LKRQESPRESADLFEESSFDTYFKAPRAKERREGFGTSGGRKVEGVGAPLRDGAGGLERGR